MSWLTPFRQGTGYEKQEVFARAMHVSAKTVQRWENHYPDCGEIPFARIAKLLGRDEAALHSAHAEDLARHRASVDRGQLGSALSAVTSELFQSRLLAATERGTLAEAVEVLAGHIEREEDDRLLSRLNRAATDFLDQAGKEDQASLLALRELYAAVLLACAVPLSGLDEAGSAGAGQTHPVRGVNHAHTLIFLIDSTWDRRGHQRLVAADEHRLDDHRDTTLCITFSDCGADKDQPEEWVHRFVGQVGATLGLAQPCPAYHEPHGSDRFDAYCVALDDALGARNTGDRYLFARCDGPIPAGVFDLLRHRLSNLYLFECREPRAARCSVMRGRPGVLGAWMAGGIWAVEGRMRALGLAVPNPRSRASAQGEAEGRSITAEGPKPESPPKKKSAWETAAKNSEHAAKLSRHLKQIVKDWLPRVRWPFDDKES